MYNYMKVALHREWAPGNFPKSFSTAFPQKNFWIFLSVTLRVKLTKMENNWWL